MPAITVKNIPEKLYSRIKESAKTHHRSINNEIIHRLQKSLFAGQVDPEKLIARAKSIQDNLKLPPLTDDFLRQARDEGRP